MQTVITDYLKQLKVGRKQFYKNLALFPLLSESSTNVDYVTLDEALKEDWVEIAEIDQGGSVPEIKFINRSPRRILILDGEELVGAKQNRVVNTTIILEAHSTTVIPVSCVEQGRWSYKSARFHTEERLMSAELRAMKARQVRDSVRESGNFRADQAAIWDKIEEKSTRMRAASPSMAMSYMYKRKKPETEEYLTHFRPVDMQVGAVLMINGRIVGLDSFAKPGTLSEVFKKLLESYALDAIDWFEPEEEYKIQESEVTNFLKASFSAKVESHPSVALGRDCRLDSDKLTGFALVLEGEVLHLSMFAGNGRGNGSGRTSRMQRLSARRRNRQ